MVRMIHQRCGKPAFLHVDGELVQGELIRIEEFAHLDGRPVDFYEFRRCDSCGEQLGQLTFDEVRPEA